MKQLPNNCRVGKFSVSPNNWKTTKADISKPWTITYWFYDDNLGTKKQVRVQGMNHAETQSERKYFTIQILEDELTTLKDGYNPITEIFYRRKIQEVEPETPFGQALKFALTKKKCTPKHLKELESYINNIIGAYEELKMRIPIGSIQIKHLTRIFDKLSERKTWSANQHNVHRKSLCAVIEVLDKYGAVIVNFAKKLPIEKDIIRIKKILTKDQITKIFNHLKIKNYSFWRFANIFFYSGCRESELLRLQARDIDLEHREFKIIVYKGAQAFEDIRAITEAALPHWVEIMEMAKSKEDYVFGKGLVPGSIKIPPIQITRRWRNQVKNKFEIDVDFYALKHLYLDMVSESTNLLTASNVAGHTNIKTTKKHYTVNEKRRELDIAKNLKISFVNKVG